MEQQSGNNFEGLFQKAAEEYPLKTDNSNWDIVAAKLNTPKPALIIKSSKKLLYAALLLLLSTAGGFFAYQFYNSLNTGNNHSKISINKSSKTNGLRLPGNQTATSNNRSSIPQEPGMQNNSINLSANSSLINKQTYQQHNVLLNTKTTSNISLALSNNSVNATASSSLQHPASSLNIDSNNADISNVNNDVVVDKNSTNQLNESSKKSNNAEENISNAENQHIKLNSTPTTFYGELFFAPDFSTVKFEHVNNPGYKVGVALGYRISKHFSAELGLERLHTDFFSNAKYLNTTNIKFKPNTKVQSVNGQSKLTEVPFNIRYNLSKNNEHFFVTAGTAIARIIHTEKYNYHVTRDGAPREVSRHFGALTATKFLSDINFSIGYQTTVIGSYKIKVEPYYQAPLKGLGIGSLPVNNFGINVGVVKDLK